MEKRAFLAIALSFLIYAVFVALSPPPKQPARVAPAPVSEAPAPAPAAALTETAADPALEVVASVAAETEEDIRISNGLIEAKFTNRGARATEWSLLEFKTPSGQPLQLFPVFREQHPRPLSFDLDDPVIAEALNAALYQVERTPLPPDDPGGRGERLEFRWSDGRGLSARKAFTIRERSYLVEIDAEVVDRGRPRPVRLTLGPGLGAQESVEGRSNYYYEGQALWNVGGAITRQAPKKLDPEGGFAGRLRWAGLEDQYFAALLVPRADTSALRWRRIDLSSVPYLADGEQAAEEAPAAAPVAILSVDLPPGGATLFVGPKKYTLLARLGDDLDRAVWFSSYEWLRPIVEYLFLALIWIHDHLAHNWGMAIVLATVALRILLFPVNQYSMVAMKKSQLQMQRIQPKINAIRTKYRKLKDAQSRGKMNQEMMDLYKKEGINPAAGLTGCLPLLAQFPILIGFYNMLTVAVELRGAPFYLWIHDLSSKDPFLITPILMAATMFWQQKLAMAKVKDPQQLQQQRIMLFMPFMFGFFCLQMPSGLVLYWFVNNLLGIGQQWLVNRHADKLEAAAAKA